MTETSRDELFRIIQEALGQAPFSMRQLADEVGLSYDTFYSWSNRRRTPKAEHLRDLAAGLEKRAQLLCKLAEDLRGVADRSNNQES